MVHVIPKTKEVTSWTGLHLFHFGMSNCSQRVRIMLEEKHLPWIVNLHRLQLMHFPMKRYPALQRWVSAMRKRPSYGPSLKQYEPSAALGFIRLYSWFRANFGNQAFAQAPC